MIENGIQGNICDMFKVIIPVFYKFIWVGVGNIVDNLIHNLVWHGV